MTDCEPPILLGRSDLVVRWSYTREGVRLLMRQPDFPAPVAIINNGRNEVWAIEDIEAYEADKPEFFSARAKRAKVRGYHRVLAAAFSDDAPGWRRS